MFRGTPCMTCTLYSVHAGLATKNTTSGDDSTLSFLPSMVPRKRLYLTDVSDSLRFILSGLPRIRTAPGTGFQYFQYFLMLRVLYVLILQFIFQLMLFVNSRLKTRFF